MVVPWKKVRKYSLLVLFLFLAYEILFGIVPYAIPAKVSENFKQNVDVLSFYGKNNEEFVDRVRLVEEVQDSFYQRIALIESAEKTIDFSCYTIQDGVTTKYLFGAILKAANRGVQVRILLDSMMGGLKGSCADIKLALLNHPNVKFYSYNPLNLLKPWLLNVRMHDKYMIADERIMILGGRNIGDKYFNLSGYTGEVTNDRDVLVYNTSYRGSKGKEKSSILQTREYFESILKVDLTVLNNKKISESKQKEAKAAELQVIAEYEEWRQKEAGLEDVITIAASDREIQQHTVPTNNVTLIHNPIEGGKKDPWVLYQLLELAKIAEEYIIIQSPYTVVDNSVIKEFHEIGKKEVRFELLTNSLASTPNVPAFSTYLGLRKNLVETGIQIYEIQATASIHGKSLLYDGRISAIGSFNFDERSIYIDTEVMLVIDSEEFASILGNQIKNYQDISLVVGQDNEYIPNDKVKELPVGGGKKLLYGAASFFFRIFQFLI